MARQFLAALLGTAFAVLGACGDEDEGAAPEIVVTDAALAGAAPVVIGATADAVFWTASPAAGTTHIGGASLATIPGEPAQLATAVGPAAHAGDHVVFAAGSNVIARVGLETGVERIARGTPEMLATRAGTPMVVAWSEGATVSWGMGDSPMTHTYVRVDAIDHATITGSYVYVALDNANGRRLSRIEQRTAMVTSVTSSSEWAAMFPGGARADATYVGRIVDATDEGALWLVEESGSGRGIVIHMPRTGEGQLILQHVSGASGFFATAETLYWQERDALLAAPRSGGPASIIAKLDGRAGALADGYVYFASGTSIARLRVE